jgi:hypothetical protein
LVLILLIDDNELNISLSDTFDNYHTYEVQWTPDSITWLVDGQVGRTLLRADTWNASANQWNFPQTPARVQLSLWPGGLSTSAPGTIAWAGGLVNWDSIDIQTNGYYYATFESVTVECYNTTSPPGTNTGVSYTYDNYAGTNNTVVDGDKPTVLSSFLATGLNMTIGAESSSSSSASGTKSGATPSASSPSGDSIPGLDGVGVGAAPDADSTSTTAAAADPSATETASGSTSTGVGGFSQGSSSGAEKLGNQETVMKGSVFAGIVAVVAMMAL